MLKSIFKSLFKSRNERLLNQYRHLLCQINDIEPNLSKISDGDLKYLADNLVHVKPDQLLVKTYALVREVAKRTLGLRAFDVQILGAIALSEGKIAEMQTGEGKTLVSAFPVILHALGGKGVHVITANPYLAKRDAQYLAPVYTFFGLSVGINEQNLSSESKKAAYKADITYGTAAEFGFDYLRDNMAHSLNDQVARAYHFVLIDEVDAVLIDDASTPLIISGLPIAGTHDYVAMNEIAKSIVCAHTPEDPFYTILHDTRALDINEHGFTSGERLLVKKGLLAPGANLYETHNLGLLHRFIAALRAHALFHKDEQYLIKDGAIQIIDETTGRIATGRRWSDGLHEAVEAKEGLDVIPEAQMAATVSIQNYFKLYDKRAGMTGTADTDASELMSVYSLEVVVIPRNVASKRVDHKDLIFGKKAQKYAAIVADITDAHLKGQPILLAVPTVFVADEVAKLLQDANLPFNLLSAKDPEREAQIIAGAGTFGAITIATNMAGRGTDIALGGNDPAQRDLVLSLGGLYVLGVEHHNSRRVDNQLRGRSGRQSDIGQTRFYLSFEDDFFLPFGKEGLGGIAKILDQCPNGYEGKLLDDAINKAHRKIEATFFEARKYMLDFDNIITQQRLVVYDWRTAVLMVDNLRNTLNSFRGSRLNQMLDQYLPLNSIMEEWDINGLEKDLAEEFVLAFNISLMLETEEYQQPEGLRNLIASIVTASINEKLNPYPIEWIDALLKQSLLKEIDKEWIENLGHLEVMKKAIQLRAVAQKDPKQEFAREAFEAFEGMLQNVKINWNKYISAIQIQVVQEAPKEPEADKPQLTLEV